MREKLRLYKVDDGECLRLFWDHSEESLRENLRPVFEENEIESITDITDEAREKHSPADLLPKSEKPHQEYSESIRRDLGWDSSQRDFILCEACNKYDWDLVQYCQHCNTCDECRDLCPCGFCDRCCTCDDDDSDLISE